jgi:hypothetical protein
MGMRDGTAPPRGGVTNSRPNDKNVVADAEVAGGGAVCSDAGIDTVRFRLRLASSARESLARGSKGGRAHDGPRGELWTHTGTARVGAYPDGLVYVEGRAAALLERNADCHDLLAPADLPLAERAARAQLEAVGVPADEHVTLGRVDLAGELRFSRGDEGIAFLHALRALDVPWGKVGSEGGKGGAIETVYVRGMNGRTVHARAYDKGVESQTDAPGRRVRYERQHRARKAREQTVAQFLAGDLRAHFLGRLVKYQATDRVVVSDVVGALDALTECSIAATKRNRLAGYLIFGRAGMHVRARQRYDAELRSLGIALDPTVPDRLTVPVGRHLQALASAWPEAA